MPVKTTKKTEKAVKEPKKAAPAAEAVVVATPKVIAPKPAPVHVINPEDGYTTADFIISEKDVKADKYFAAIGRRKTAVARVRLHTKGDKGLVVNGKPYKEFFAHQEFQERAAEALKSLNCLDKFRIVAQVRGGGTHAQAEAVRHGIARVLVEFNPNLRKKLRKDGFLTRDPRMRERKKFGLRRARRAPQWAKR